MTIPGRISELDGVRGIAVLLVIVYHAVLFNPSLESYLPAMTPYAHAGVDLFFVLSGFLITGILLGTKDRRGYFRNFYAKRAMRIWPLYYLLLAITFVVVPLLASHVNLASGESDLIHGQSRWAYLLLIQNWLYRIDSGPKLLSMTWSLAIEEQFYILWPALVALCKPKKLGYILCFVVILSAPFRFWAGAHGFTGEEIYRMTWFRLDGLALGSLMALWTRDESFDLARSLRFGLAALTVGVLGFFFSPPWLLDTAVSFGCAGLLTTALWCAITRSPAGVIFRLSGLRFLGLISYCLYLVHQPMYYALAGIAKNHFGRFNATVNVGVMVAGFAASVAIATLSWYAFESQILKFKNRLEYRDETLVVPPDLAEVPVIPVAAPQRAKSRAAGYR